MTDFAQGLIIGSVLGALFGFLYGVLMTAWVFRRSNHDENK